MVLTNRFHGTEYETKLSVDEIKRRALLSFASSAHVEKELKWVKRIENILCGMNNCTCIKCDQWRMLAGLDD